MRILIAGDKGQIGSALKIVLADHDLQGLDLPEIDIGDGAAVRAAVNDFRPNIVINSAAYTNVDGCAKDPTLAFRANALGAQNLALAAAEVDAPIVQISTNEVFPGEKMQGYNEWDAIRPINPYGDSKAAGEFMVRNAWRKHFIVRTAWIYAPGGRNFIHAILNFAQKNGAVRVVTDEVGNPTYAWDVAEAIGKLILTDQYGTYHFVNEGACSRWEFANEILRLAKLNHVTNTQILGNEFKRLSTPPQNCALKNSAAAAIGIRLRPWQEALVDYFDSHVSIA